MGFLATVAGAVGTTLVATYAPKAVEFVGRATSRYVLYNTMTKTHDEWANAGEQKAGWAGKIIGGIFGCWAAMSPESKAARAASGEKIESGVRLIGGVALESAKVGMNNVNLSLHQTQIDEKKEQIAINQAKVQTLTEKLKKGAAELEFNQKAFRQSEINVINEEIETLTKEVEMLEKPGIAVEKTGIGRKVVNIGMGVGQVAIGAAPMFIPGGTAVVGAYKVVRACAEVLPKVRKALGEKAEENKEVPTLVGITRQVVVPGAEATAHVAAVAVGRVAEYHTLTYVHDTAGDMLPFQNYMPGFVKNAAGAYVAMSEESQQYAADVGAMAELATEVVYEGAKMVAPLVIGEDNSNELSQAANAAQVVGLAAVAAVGLWFAPMVIGPSLVVGAIGALPDVIRWMRSPSAQKEVEELQAEVGQLTEEQVQDMMTDAQETDVTSAVTLEETLTSETSPEITATEMKLAATRSAPSLGSWKAPLFGRNNMTASAAA